MPEKRLDGGIRRRKVTIQHHDLEVPAKFWNQNPHGPFVRLRYYFNRKQSIIIDPLNLLLGTKPLLFPANASTSCWVRGHAANSAERASQSDGRLVSPVEPLQLGLIRLERMQDASV